MPSAIIDKLKWRYATKKFDPTKKLSGEKLEILKQTFNLTATSYGLQPLKTIIVADQELKEKLVPYTFNQLQVRDASHVFVLCVERGLDAQFIKDHFARIEVIRQTDREILEPFELFLIENFKDKNAETIQKWMINQLYLTMGALLTVCASEKIDACPIEGFEPEKYDEILQLRDHNLQSVLVLPVGYRADDDFFATLPKVRRGVEEVVIEM